MNMLYYFVVDLPSRFHDEIAFADTTLKVETKFNEFEHRVNQGEVHSIPAKFDTPVQPGDTLFFHHHVVINGGIPLEGYDNKYLVRYDPNHTMSCHAFAYRPKGSDVVHPLGGWSVLSPIEEDAELQSESLDLVELEERLPTRGVVAFDCEELKEVGLKKGDTVGFLKNMDYRFKIDGVEHYRTRVEDLLYAV